MSSVLRPEFNFKIPDYAAIFAQRAERLIKIRSDPRVLPALFEYYKTHIPQFIIDWGCTWDPKNIERNLPAFVPFILFERQAEWIDWVIDHWRRRKNGLTAKTRQMGFSWMSEALACSMCIFHPGMSVGFGSRNVDYVDVIGDPKSLIEKGRMFMRALPIEFRGAWRTAHKRIIFDNGSLIVGEGGDELGRGNSTSIYFVDEAAYLEHPRLVEAALSQTTNCRMDISTPNGLGNPFAEKRFSMPPDDVFIFHWRDDPRKDEDWYNEQKEKLDPVILAAEVDVSFSASIEGVVIPSEWIQEAIDAHAKLGLEPTGGHFCGLDVADEGRDMNAFAARHGVVLEHLEEWSGKGGDIFHSVIKAFSICDEMGYDAFEYDADGLGAGVRGDAAEINRQRKDAGIRQISDSPFRGSGAVVEPDGEMVPERTNKDYFYNLKAQSYWALRLRFQETHRAISGSPYNADDIISIDSTRISKRLMTKLTMELCQPIYRLNNVGKIIIDKLGDGVRSPNLSDCVMIAYNPSSAWMEMMRRLAG